MQNQLTYFPLGTRCNSASIIRDGLGHRQASYPFDWIDVDLKTLLTYLQVPVAEIETYFTKYIMQLSLVSKVDGAWYPHELIDNEPVPNIETGPVLKAIAQKYIRRYKRMHDLFASGQNICFLTVMPYTFPESEATYK